MIPALVKIDVAAALLRLSPKALFELADGSPRAHQRALVFVFDVATRTGGRRRDLRFWLPEVEGHAQRAPDRHAALTLREVIDQILPARRTRFHAGEVDRLFQMRHCTRAKLNRELHGTLCDGRHHYPRPALAAFLERRWLGAAAPALLAPQPFGMRVAPGHPPSRRSLGGSSVRRLVLQNAEQEPGSNQNRPPKPLGGPPPGSYAPPRTARIL